MRGTSAAKVRRAHARLFDGLVPTRRLFQALVVALVGAFGLAIATLVGAGGGYIGVAVGTEELGGKSSERGVVVQAIAPNSPAMLAGLMSGDVVVAADNTRIRSADELRRYISSKYPKEIVALVVIRDRGTARTVSKVNVTLTDAPAVASAPPASASPSPESQGSSADRVSVPSEPEFF
jgi:membrane-associated protease RseP (regulator of RpoE activity)